MKKVLLCIAFSVLLLNSYAQKKFRAFEFSMDYSNSGNGNNKWQDIDYLVVIDFEKNFKIFGTSTEQLDVISSDSYKFDEDNNIVCRYHCVDNEGKKCEVVWITYKDKTVEHIGTLIIEYSDMTYALRLKNND